jgi:N-acylglucosamine 2-epimerase
MNRRKFLTASVVSPWLASPPARRPPRAKSAPAAGRGETLAGMPLEDLRRQYHDDLFQDFLPFMDAHVIDHEYGGFMCNTDRDGRNLSGEKDIWFEGRGIWVYSFLYRNFRREAKYLDIARKSLEFVLKVQPRDRQALWPVRFTRQGRPLGSPPENIYGDVFVAEGMAEFARASGDSRFRDMARDILLKCWGIYNRPDYDPDIVAEYAGPKPFPFPGARVQGVAMVMIHTISEMLEAGPEPELEPILADCLEAVLERHFNPAFSLNNELLNHDYSRPTDGLAEFVYTGHSIETLWMMAAEAVRRRDAWLFGTVAQRFRRHTEVAWDDVYGGVFRSLNNVDENLWSLDKVLWEQEEVMNGCLLLLEQAGDAWARNMFGRMYGYVRSKYPLQPHGYHLWITSADRKVTYEPHATRVENYHHPRHLMLALLILNRRIQQSRDFRPPFAGSATREQW